MSPLLSRILLTIVLFPLATLFNLIVYLACDEHLEGEIEIAVPAMLTAIFAAGYWLFVWRKAVRWTGRRVTRTLIAAGAAATISAAIVAGCAVAFENFDSDIATYVGCVLAPLLWMIATAFIWRETAAEREVRLTRPGGESIVCPACTYDLTGLREARCPECGAQYTLNELFASQPGRAAAEIEG